MPYSPFMEGLFRALPAKTEADDNPGKHNSHAEAAGTWGSGLTSALVTPSYGAERQVGVVDTVIFLPVPAERREEGSCLAIVFVEVLKD